MRILLQVIEEGTIEVEDEEVASVKSALCLYVAVEGEDDLSLVDGLAEKILNLRVFPDDDRPFQLSARDTGSEVLLISNFTLAGSTASGRRPSWSAAADPAVAQDVMERLSETLAAGGLSVSHGSFGTRMRVTTVNDGPTNLLILTAGSES